MSRSKGSSFRYRKRAKDRGDNRSHISGTG